MAQKKASLACVECGSRNYSIGVSGNPKPNRLEVNKFCKYCKKYTLHKETRQEKKNEIHRWRFFSSKAYDMANT